MKRGAKWHTPQDCALKITAPDVRRAASKGMTKKEFRAHFDDFKAMVIANATQGQGRA